MSQRQPVDNSVQKIKFLFQILGLNIEDRPKKWSQIFLYTFNSLWMTTDTIGVLNFIFQGGRSIPELTHVTLCVNLALNAQFKTASLVAYEKKVHQLLNNLRDMERQRLTDNAHGHKMAKREIKYLYLLLTSMTTINFILAVLFVFGPLASIAVKYFINNELELTLPFLDIYPFDCYDLRIWPFAYMHQIWTAWTVQAEILAADFLFYVCCTHIKIQFQLLQHEVENVIPYRNVSHKLTGAARLKENFNDLVKWHQAIISCADELEDIYAKSTLFNYISGSFNICLALFQLEAANNKTALIAFGVIPFVVLTQIFFLCFFGDTLMRSSSDVSQAVYNCKWYLADVSTCKSAIILLARAQKPCKVTAAGFADVNLNAFMKILSSSWSYFTLLRTMYDQ